MRTRVSVVLLLAASAVTSLSAHPFVGPPPSKAPAVPEYELRVHNEAKTAATSVDLDIPDGVTVTEVAKPSAGTYTTKTVGDRITVITWQVDVQPSKYVALPFTAKNPRGGDRAALEHARTSRGWVCGGLDRQARSEGKRFDDEAGLRS